MDFCILCNECKCDILLCLLSSNRQTEENGDQGIDYWHSCWCYYVWTYRRDLSKYRCLHSSRPLCRNHLCLLFLKDPTQIKQKRHSGYLRRCLGAGRQPNWSLRCRPNRNDCLQQKWYLVISSLLINSQENNSRMDSFLCWNISRDRLGEWSNLRNSDEIYAKKKTKILLGSVILCQRVWP